MKFFRKKFFFIFVLLTFLSIFSIKSKKNKKEKDSLSIKEAKKYCKLSCNKEGNNIPHDLKMNLFIRLRNIKTEFYICRCNLIISGGFDKTIYYYANRYNIKNWIKTDDDRNLILNKKFAGNKSISFGYKKLDVINKMKKKF